MHIYTHIYIYIYIVYINNSEYLYCIPHKYIYIHIYLNEQKTIRNAKHKLVKERKKRKKENVKKIISYIAKGINCKL